ncbi:MAG TPA: tyrosine-type recombinase/integrase [Ktedonobacterales bacterium]|nr:tyrosine-type recombinase/integrase [Ktedonobacterales bacterium]
MDITSLTTATAEAVLATQDAQDEPDQQVIGMWLHGRPASTQQVYRNDVVRFMSFIAPKTLRTCTLGDLQRYADSLGHLAPATQNRMLSTVKSLLSFANKEDYCRFNVGANLRMKKPKNKLAERILSEEAVQKMLALETNPRNHALLRLLYGAGLRVSEAVSLKWRDLQERGEGGQVNVFGKGDKTRVVLVSAATWAELQALPGDHGKDSAVFMSQKKGHLSRVQVWEIIKAAADRAQLAGVSPHWLRHAHASHALDRGAPISLVSATLGHADLKTTSKYVHARPDHSSSEYLPV